MVCWIFSASVFWDCFDIFDGNGWFLFCIVGLVSFRCCVIKFDVAVLDLKECFVPEICNRVGVLPIFVKLLLVIFTVEFCKFCWQCSDPGIFDGGEGRRVITFSDCMIESVEVMVESC